MSDYHAGEELLDENASLRQQLATLAGEKAKLEDTYQGALDELTKATAYGNKADARIDELVMAAQALEQQKAALEERVKELEAYNKDCDEVSPTLKDYESLIEQRDAIAQREAALATALRGALKWIGEQPQTTTSNYIRKRGYEVLKQVMWLLLAVLIAGCSTVMFDKKKECIVNDAGPEHVIIQCARLEQKGR